MKIKSFLVLSLSFFISTQVQAWTLMSPTAGDIKSRTVTLPFGGNWVNSCEGSIKKHSGVDIRASKGEKIYAAYDGIVKVAKLDAAWGGWVTIDHGPTHTFNLTTVYWHIIPSVVAGSWIGQGQLIGKVADLGNNTHFHFGVRKAAYSNVANAGGLPQTNCGGYPAFPEYFINPMSLKYEYNYN